ncbi:hypothetical protein ACQKLN_11190 [Paenibacillus glucanolyticus]|uniref:hypothetical protein n=1 Tax=Paenibacillus glucanolyticus TaxID=59843 RepID=UPI003CFE851E
MKFSEFKGDRSRSPNDPTCCIRRFPLSVDPSPHLPAMLPEQRWPSPESGRSLSAVWGGEDVRQSGNLLPFTLRWLLRSGGCVAAAGVVK